MKQSKRGILNRLLSLLIVLAVMATTLTFNGLTVSAEATSRMTLAELQAKFPNGKYWNHQPGTAANPDSWTDTPSTHGRPHNIYTGSCGCNCYDGAIQCHGFALKLGADAFGAGSPRNWSRIKGSTAVSYLDSLKPGDIITSDSPYHTVFVIGVTGTTVTVGECNRGYDNRIEWGRVINKSKIRNYGGLEIYIAPDTLTTSAPSTTPTVKPEISVSKNSVSMKAGQSVTLTVTVKTTSDSIIVPQVSTTQNMISWNWGKQSSDGTTWRIPLTINGTCAGTTDFSLILKDKQSNAVLASTKFKVTVTTSGKPKATISPSALSLNVGESQAVKVNVERNGTRVSVDNAVNTLCDRTIEVVSKGSNGSFVLRYTGKTPGSTTQNIIFKDANGKVLATYPLPITVKEKEPDYIRAEERSVELKVGERITVPVTFRVDLASQGLKSARFDYEIQDSSICSAKWKDGVVPNLAELELYGAAPGTTTVDVSLCGIPGFERLVSDSFRVTVKEAEKPPTLRISKTAVYLKEGETGSLDISWSGTVRKGYSLGVESVQEGSQTVDAVALKLTELSSTSARLNITGVKPGESMIDIFMKDASGNVVASMRAAATVTGASVPASIVLRSGGYSTPSLNMGDSVSLSYELSGDYDDIRITQTEGLYVEEVSRSASFLTLRVTAIRGGVQGLTVALVDEQNRVLAEAGKSFSVGVVVVGVTTVEADPDDGATGIADTPAADGVVVSVVGQESVWVTTQVHDAAGATYDSIALEPSGEFSTQSAAVLVMPPSGFSASGSAEIEVDTESTGSQGTASAGSGDLSGEVLIDFGESDSNELLGITSDGDVFQVSDETEAGMRFLDVSSGKYYYDAVLWADSAGVTAGISGTKLAPDNPCPRGQVMEFMWRALGCPEPSIDENPFTDISAGDSYYKAVLWAYGAGITTGTTATLFSPGSTCTRGQVVTFLWRANNRPDASARNAFSDVSAGAYYADSVYWAVENGITNGTTSTTFSPGSTCTRGQILTFLYRGMA